ncbi:glutathione S-transferase family protein [Brevundimonas sp.]|uniref:glutathione S-transferase family protein n=1 Tax=Brevundimonas sp. TaxID=1871086 RepID=UPI003D0F1C2D
MPTITAFANSPDRGRGLARDTRVRWALEEVGQAYDVQLLTFPEMKEPSHLALNPFGQIPTWEEDGLALFESGAIILRIAETHPGLLPAGEAARARAIMWMFAAVNTVEPPIVDRSMVFLFEREEPWFETRLTAVETLCRRRLEQLSAWLGETEWLDGDFSVGDLMMISVLQRLGSSGIVERFPNLAAYVTRGEARPAYQSAFAAQLAVFEAAQKAG